jgi:MoaA/NifB/PqqE/SkfB family radical SAM enzyme
MGPSGIHLFNRATGQNVLLEDFELPTRLWARAPRQVSIALTNACDLKCAYCYAPKTPATLSLDTVKSWLCELDVQGCLGVGFGGGEPTLYKHLDKLCCYAATNTRLAVTFTTHAHRIDDMLVQKLQGNIHFIRVSMDGVGSTYEQLRGRSFTTLCSRLKAIRSLAPFGINYVVNAQTLPDLDSAVALAAEMGAREFLLLPEQAVHGTGGIDSCSASSLRQWVRRYRGRLPLSISEASAEGFPTCNPLVAETGLRAYAHIDASGVLKRSSYDSWGVFIGADGVMSALTKLETQVENQP